MTLAGCREPLLRLAGDASPAGKERAVVAIEALAARVDDPMRDHRFETARARIANAALIPSRVFGDSAAWTSSGSRERTLSIAGHYRGGRYRLYASPTVNAPARPADSRHTVRLTRLSTDEFAWDTEVAYALGAVRARDVADAIRALFTATQGRTESEVRSDYRRWLPRSSAVMGRLFRLDSMRISNLPDGSTLTTLSSTITPAGIENRHPNFAEYMVKYSSNVRMHWRLADRGGAAFFDFQFSDGRLRVRVRSREGRLVPIAGAAKPLPDTLVLHGDLRLKVRVFSAGVRNFRASFILENQDNTTGFTLVSREEPEWELPLVAERLLRTPLKRPFEGTGLTFSMSVSDSTDAQTLLRRALHLEVQESAVLRFFARLGSAAYSDFAGKVEKEQHLWTKELLAALAEDVKGL